MENRRRSLSIGVGMLALCALARAQSVGRFDMGGALPTAAGFASVDSNSAFGSAGPWGWLPGAALTDVVRPIPGPEIISNLDRELIRDSVVSSSPFTFRYLAGPGTYACVAYLGDMGVPGGAPVVLTPMYGMNIAVNGSPVIQGAFARLVRGKATTLNSWGGFKRVAFLANSVGGSIDIEFSGTAGSSVSVMGLEIYPYAAPPISFDHATNGLIAAPGYQALLSPFLAAFAAHDYVGAQAALNALPAGAFADLGKAWGLSWLQGWLTDDQLDVDPSVLAQVETLLTSPAQSQDSWPVASLLADVRDFTDGELFTRTRGYSSTTLNPQNLQGILRNMNAGAQLLEQIDDDVLDLTPNNARPDAPLYPKAAYLLARGMYGRNTRVNQGVPQNPTLFVEFNLQFVAILQKIWQRCDPSTPLVRLFPKCADALVLSWYMNRHCAQPSGPLGPWDGVSTPPTPTSTWYSPLVDFGVLPGHNPPVWARQQRHYSRMMRNLGGWWFSERMVEGELGGGAGDDVEAAGALSVPVVIKTEGPDHVFEAGVKLVQDGVLFGPDVDPDQGFVNPPAQGPCLPGVMDPEHAGEFTTYPLFYLMPTYYGDPRYIEYAMRTIRNFEEPPDPTCGDTSWTGFRSWSPWRRFKAFRLGAHGYEHYTGGAYVDMATTELMKDILPGFTLLDYNGSPTVKQYWYELARGWAETAMDPALGYLKPKPLGIFPVGVRFSNGEMGEHLQWWSNSQQNGGGVGLFNYDLYYMLLTAYRTGSTLSTSDRIKLLEPIYWALDFLAQTTPDGSKPAGSAEWTAAQVQYELGAIASVARPEMVNVMGFNPATLDRLVASYGSTYLTYLNSAATPGAPKNKATIEALFAESATWLQHFWPMATTTVSYTDRIWFLPISSTSESSLLALYSTMSGSQFSIAPTFPLSWSQPKAQLTTNDPYAIGCDTAILVNELHGDVTTSGSLALKVLLFNFTAGPVDIDLRVWRGLPVGSYTAHVGADANWDDSIDGAPSLSLPFNLTGRGDKLSIPALPAGVLQVLDLVYNGAGTATAPTLDLGIGAEDITTAASTVTVRVHNIGVDNYPANTGAVVRLFDDATNTPLAGSPIPAVPAPVGLNPSWVDVQLTLPGPVAPGTRLRARLSLPAGTLQITTLNDRAIRQF